MICPKCGAVLRDGSRFCESCGAPIAEDNVSDVQSRDSSGYGSEYASSQQDTGGYGSGSSGYPGGGMIKERSIPLYIILSIITCGIFSLYWIYVLNDDVSHTAGEEAQTSGGMVILLSIVTCGIYALYWLFKKGEEVTKIKADNGQVAGNDPILYLILGLFGLTIIDLALMQDTVNKYGA
ncbi:MAG TPA: hypothetical protein DCL38_10065 [Lachnospiraceae bacterium]|nr:hypothetical protein [Lachnospiraceae bacterium]